MKTCTLNGHKYHIDVSGKIDGCCDKPNFSIPTIILCRDLSTRAGFETAIHEGLHICFPYASEEHIERSGKDLVRLLWGLGYRHVKD